MTRPKVPVFLEDAFNENYSYVDEGKQVYYFYCQSIGKLNIESGKIIACDPLLFNDDKPFDTLFPIGRFSIELAIAKRNTDERIGFARIKFSDKVPARWT